MPKYAAGTKVTGARSREEIEHLLERYGATAFAYGREGRAASIMFDLGGRRVRIQLPLPDPGDREFSKTPSGRWERAPAEAQNAYDQAVRQRWRALVLVTKAKLEAVEAKITTVEQEFLAGVVLPGGQTVGEWVQPQLKEIYGRGELPALLPGGSHGEDH